MGKKLKTWQASKCPPPLAITQHELPDHYPPSPKLDDYSHDRWSCQPLPQSGSPLFIKIAAEIRSMILRYVVVPDDDQCKQGFFVEKETGLLEAQHMPIFRPRSMTDRTKRRGIVALLQTCQTIYREVQEFSVETKIHFLHYPIMRQSYTRDIPNSAQKCLRHLAPRYISQITYLHLFAGSNRLVANYGNRPLRNNGRWLDTGSYSNCSPLAELCAVRCGGDPDISMQPLRPKYLTITIRHTDWRSSSFPPRGYSLSPFLRDQKWNNVFEGIHELRMELELKTKETELIQETVDELKMFVFNLDDKSRLVPDSEPWELQWGPPLAPGQKKSDDPDREFSSSVSRRYTVYVFRWKFQEVPQPAHRKLR